MDDRPANDCAPHPAGVRRALEALAAEPARRWTVAALARVAGLSRAAFARRFTCAVGRPPLRFLSDHRLAIARARLLETDQTLAAIADEIGYSSEFAFAKAWKRAFGLSPGAFRRLSRTGPPTTFRAAA